MWKRYSFKTRSVHDHRPLIFSTQYPWWLVEYGNDIKGDYVSMVSFLPPTENLYTYWDDAENVEVEDFEKIVFSEKFPKPFFYTPVSINFNQKTTINFDGDIKMNSEFRKYDKNSEFIIMKQTKKGLYVLMDENNNEIVLPKKNINFFKDKK